MDLFQKLGKYKFDLEECVQICKLYNNPISWNTIDRELKLAYRYCQSNQSSIYQYTQHTLHLSLSPYRKEYRPIVPQYICFEPRQNLDSKNYIFLQKCDPCINYPQ